MRPGDRVFIYHTGGQSAIVGLAEVVSDPRPDPSDEKSAVVDMKYISHLNPPTTLAAIKADSRFAGWSLVKQGRLSTMEAPAEFVTWIRKQYQDSDI
jgi:predicted RNA-binding protein with PUA-like domain